MKRTSKNGCNFGLRALTYQDNMEDLKFHDININPETLRQLFGGTVNNNNEWVAPKLKRIKEIPVYYIHGKKRREVNTISMDFGGSKIPVYKKGLIMKVKSKIKRLKSKRYS